MSGIFVDSFSYYTTPLQKWDAHSGGNGISIDLTAGPRGGGALVFNGSNGSGVEFKTYPSALSTVIHQFRFKKTGSGSALGEVLSFLDDASFQVHLGLRSDLYLALYRESGGTELAVTPSPIPGNTWVYLKIKLTLGNPSGLFQLYVDNVLSINFTGRTQYTANTSMTQFRVGAGDNPAIQAYWADFIVMDTNGAQNNDFIAEMAVDAPLADAAGAYSQWTPLSGANYTNVNTAPPDSAKFNTSSTVGNQDAYHYPDVAAGTIAMIADNLLVKTTGGGAATIKSIFRSNSIDAYGPDKAVPSDYHDLQSISELSPATGIPWTTAELNNTMPARAQFGQYVVAV